VMQYMSASDKEKMANQLMQQQINSDQWRGEQSKYFQPLYDTATKGIGGTAYGDAVSSETARKMASLGYNVSGNQMTEIAKSLDSGANQRIAALAPLAMGRGESTAYSNFGNAAMSGQQGQNAAFGYGVNQIANSSVPTGLEGLFNSKPGQTVGQSVGSMFGLV